MNKAVKIIKIAAVAVLLTSLVCLSLIYMSFYRNEESVEFTPKMDAAVRNKVYRAGYVGLMNESLVQPYFLGYSFGGTRLGFFGAGAGEYFSELVSGMSVLLGPDVRFAAADDSAFRAVFDGDFIYLKFRFELPRSLIYYMLNTDMILEDVGGEYVYDMVISLGSSRQTYAVIRDMRGNYYTSSPDSFVNVNTNTFAPYNDREDGIGFSFVYESVEDTALLTVGGKSADAYEILAPFDMTARSAVVETGDMLRGDDAARALALLGMRPENVTSHESEDGVTYYGEGASVRTGKDGTLVYSAASPQYGVGISDIVGYAFNDDNYNVTDCVGAALVIADTLGIFDGDAFGYAVTRAETDGAETTVGISYTYDGLTVMTDGTYALKMTVTDGKVTALSCFFGKAHAYSGTTTAANSRWRARLAVADCESQIAIQFVQMIKNSRLYLSLAVFDRGEGVK